jgi:hypothetical protein
MSKLRNENVSHTRGDINMMKRSIVGLEAIVKAVAHIGIDFGYGVYEIETKHIESARQYFLAKEESK